MGTKYLEIHNGDICVYYDDQNNFMGADTIRFGEYGSYEKDEEKEFIGYLDFLGLSISDFKEM